MTMRHASCRLAGAALLASLAIVPVSAGAQTASAAPDRPANANAPSALPPAQAGLAAAEDARFAAQIRKDVAAVAAGMADELVYVHASGRRQTKADYLDGLARGAMRYTSITPSQRTVTTFGTGGFTRALLTSVIGNRTLQGSYLAVYRYRQRRWQLVSWQTTPIEEPKPADPASGIVSPLSPAGANHP